MLATDLELQLVRPEARAAIRRALEAVADRGGARRVAAELDAAGTAGGVDWAAIAAEADAVASALEASLTQARDWAEATTLTATVSEAVADAFENAKALQAEGFSVVVTDIAGARYVSRYDARIVERARLTA